MSLTLLTGFTLPPTHPFAGREAFKCDVCGAISYPPHQSADGPCGACEDEADEE